MPSSDELRDLSADTPSCQRATNAELDNVGRVMLLPARLAGSVAKSVAKIVRAVDSDACKLIDGGVRCLRVGCTARSKL